MMRALFYFLVMVCIVSLFAQAYAESEIPRADGSREGPTMLELQEGSGPTVPGAGGVDIINFNYYKHVEIKGEKVSIGDAVEVIRAKFGEPAVVKSAQQIRDEGIARGQARGIPSEYVWLYAQSKERTAQLFITDDKLEYIFFYDGPLPSKASSATGQESQARKYGKYAMFAAMGVLGVALFFLLLRNRQRKNKLRAMQDRA